VISVADTYDAMTTDRPYRKGVAWDAVRAEFVRQRGKQWRERAVDCFIEMIDEDRRRAGVEQPQRSPSPVQPAAHALS
jgi:HD-GYP domain-containing protein (c-di-GMP phosphodiesterase class II)